MSARSQKLVKDLLANRTRTALVVLALAMGLAGVSATLRAQVIFSANLATELEALNPSSARVLTSGAGPGDVAAVEGVEGVSTAQGRLVTFARVGAVDDSRPIRLVAADDLSEMALDRLDDQTGQWPTPRGTIVLERSSVVAVGSDAGEELSIIDPAGETHHLRVVGTAQDLTVVSGELIDQVVYGYTSMDTLAELGVAPGFNEVAFSVTGDRSDESWIAVVADRVASELSQRGLVVRGIRIPPPGEYVLQNVITSLLLVLGSLGVLSLVLSGFLVFNTVSAMLSRQRAEIGVMKTLGGSRGDILVLFLGAVAGYSALALALAIPAGALAAHGLTTRLGDLLNVDVDNFGVPAWVWLVEIGVGLVVPLAAALGPVLSGTRVTVAEALRGDDSDSFGAGRFDRGLARIERLPATLSYAARNTFRRKLRLALTVAALSLGGAILVTVVTLRASLLDTVDSIGAYWQQDLTVDLDHPVPASRIAEVTGRVDGIADYEGWLLSSSSVVHPGGRMAGEETVVFGIPAETPFIEPTMLEGRWLEDGDGASVVVNVDVASNEPGLSLGDDVVLRVEGRDRHFELVGISTSQLVAPGEPRPSAAIAYVPIDQLDPGAGTGGLVNRVVVAESPEHDVARVLERELRDAGVAVQSVQTRSDLLTQVKRLTTPILWLLVAMAALFALVGGLGLLGTMSLNVLERTKELGTIRAVGAGGGTVRSIVLFEGLTVASISWLLGSLLALPFGWAMGYAVGVSFIKVPLEFSFAPVGPVLWLGLAALIAVISSWVPAHGASTLSVRDAIAYE